METKNQLMGRAFLQCYRAALATTVADLDDDDATQLFALTLGQVRREVAEHTFRLKSRDWFVSRAARCC